MSDETTDEDPHEWIEENKEMLRRLSKERVPGSKYAKALLFRIDADFRNTEG